MDFVLKTEAKFNHGKEVLDTVNNANEKPNLLVVNDDDSTEEVLCKLCIG
jgi:hypothetical protein